MCAAPAAAYDKPSDEFEPVASLSEVPEGRVVPRILQSGEAVCLVNYKGQISALSNICTHQHFLMSDGDLLHDGTLQCAWHGARFDCRSGEVKQIPATSPLPVYAVRVTGDRILVGRRQNREGD